jgi:hypothetical protein
MSSSKGMNSPNHEFAPFRIPLRLRGQCQERNDDEIAAHQMNVQQVKRLVKASGFAIRSQLC